VKLRSEDFGPILRTGGRGGHKPYWAEAKLWDSNYRATKKRIQRDGPASQNKKKKNQKGNEKPFGNTIQDVTTSVTDGKEKKKIENDQAKMIDTAVLPITQGRVRNRKTSEGSFLY